jgi:tetrapyrrole methylase family protein/MazG family protein/ATP diphosphatase
MPDSVPRDEQTGETFRSVVALMRRLLADDGCPWDRAQTYTSLRKYVQEEACEVLDAIDQGDHDALCEELGDLALQVAFLSELARRDGHFGPDDVMRGLCEKLVRRHPHVFGDARADDADQVTATWNAIKRAEKGDRPLLEGFPRALPALARAQRISATVACVGFDWPDSGGSRDKVTEELNELDEAIGSGDRSRVEAELGDALFALVNLARHQGVDAEAALRRTADEFSRRFAHVEQRVRERHGDWPRDEGGKPARGLDLAELDEYWVEAKKNRP